MSSRPAGLVKYGENRSSRLRAQYITGFLLKLTKARKNLDLNVAVLSTPLSTPARLLPLLQGEQ